MKAKKRGKGKANWLPLVALWIGLWLALGVVVQQCVSEDSAAAPKTGAAPSADPKTGLATPASEPPAPEPVPATPPAATAVAQNTKVSPVTVLMYHRLTTGAGSRYNISLSLFKAQMQYLVDQGYQPVTTQQYVDFLHGRGRLPEKPIMITFDDWWPEQYQYAVPVLTKLGLTAVFFVYTEKLRSPAEQRKVRELTAAGHEVASHTVHHYYLTQTPCNAKWKCCQRFAPCSESQIEYEIAVSRDDLAKVLGAPAPSFAWPGNFFNAHTIELAMAAGYSALYAVSDEYMEGGYLTGHVGITRDPSTIYRTEISGSCKLEYFQRALVTQQCCLVSNSPANRHCIPQEY